MSEDGSTTVWLFITALCVGGAERTLVDLANGLDEGYDVTVWTVFSATPLAADLEDGIAVRSLSDAGRVENGSVVGVTDPLARVRAPVRFCLAARRERPDLIHSFLYLDNVIAGLAGLISPAAVITGVRSVPDDPGRLRALADWLTIRLSDRIVSNSGAGRELAVDRGAPADRVSVVHNGRPLTTYRDAAAEAIHEELGVDGEPVVGTVGRLLERKGHFELLEAWATVREHEPDARLVLVGDGEDRAALEARAAELGIADAVHFLGTRRDVPELLAAMDVFAFPSHFEGLPGAVIEAMAAGRPIVATPVDGTAELIDGYRTGLFVPPEEPAALAWALIRALETPELRDRLGRAARERAAEAFAVDAMVDAFTQEYRAVL